MDKTMRTDFYGLAPLLSALSLGVACSAVAEGPGSGGNGPVDWSASSSVASSTATSSAGGSTSQGGAGSAGEGGLGGLGGAGGVADGGGGAQPEPEMLLMAVGPSGVVAAAYAAGPDWVSETLSGGASHAPAVAMSEDGSGVGVMRATDGSLVYSAFDKSSWSAFTQIGSATTQGGPALAVDATATHLVFHGEDFNFYYASYDGAWNPSAEPVAFASVTSFGPTAPAVAALPAETVIAHAGDDGQLYRQSRITGAWQQGGVVSGSKVYARPGIVRLDAGPELLVVYVHAEAQAANDKKLMWSTRSAGQWSEPQLVHTDAFTDEPVHLAALTGGEALVALRGTDGKGYGLHYVPGNDPPWSAPVAIGAADVTSPPALAAGLTAGEAEAAYIDQNGGAVYHIRWSGTSWGGPTYIAGSNLTHVALATQPP